MATVLARVTRGIFNRVKGGALVRYRTGEQVEVTERELERFRDRLEQVGGAAAEDESTKVVHNLTEIGAGLNVGDAAVAETLDRGQDAGLAAPEVHVEDDTAGAAEPSDVPPDAQQELEARIVRVNAAGDVQALRLLAYEFGVDVSNRWTAEKTRKEILAKLGSS